MQLKTKSKGSLNCVGVIKANDKRAKKYRAIWKENGKQKSKGFENYEDAVKFRKYIELELMNDYIQELEAQVQELNDNAIWWTNRFKAVERDNKQLKERINIYENPDDMTLMFMWCDEKAKDKIKELQQKIDKAIDFLHNNTMIGHCKEHYELLDILGDKENE